MIIIQFAVTVGSKNRIRLVYGNYFYSVQDKALTLD